MRRLLRSLVAPVFIVACALLIGLAATTLRTGRVDPLDWLLPGSAAILILVWLDRARAGEGGLARAGGAWALATLPALLLVGLAAIRPPWLGMALLGLGLAVTTLAAVLTVRGGRRRWAGHLALLLGAGLLAPHLVDQARSGDVGERAGRPAVGVLATVPLQGVAMGASLGLPPVESIGLRAPLWLALEGRFRMHPLDALDEAALKPVRILLLAQPRALAPRELVALDAWVRAGGRAVILADPLLHWPDPRPLAHPDRPPLTSLLDPLLAHWGVRLEAAELDGGGDRIERRALASGAMLQLAGASRFVAAGQAGRCALRDDGLLAQCRPGAGTALLVADADWINDTLWTLTPAFPASARGWTSDAVPVLLAWLDGDEAPHVRLGGWLAGSERLIEALRMALLGTLALAIIRLLPVARRPMPSIQRQDMGKDQIWYKRETNVDSS